MPIQLPCRKWQLLPQKQSRNSQWNTRLIFLHWKLFSISSSSTMLIQTRDAMFRLHAVRFAPPWNRSIPVTFPSKSIWNNFDENHDLSDGRIVSFPLIRGQTRSGQMGAPFVKMWKLNCDPGQFLVSSLTAGIWSLKSIELTADSPSELP